MPSYKVNVKWGKETFSDVELTTDEPPIVFKAQLFDLTGVQPERQKLMVKGVVIKDEEWGNVQLKDKMTLLLMGTKDEQMPTAPKEQVVFMEDMSESELVSALEYPAGLTNLDNTCYMNATVQCLRTVPELKHVLKKFSGGISITGSSLDTSQSMIVALRDLYDSMEKSATIHPLILLQVLHNALPRFAEKNEHGNFAQQDANEFWTELMRMLQIKLKSESLASAAYNSFIDQYFSGVFKVEMKCIESENEPPVYSTENFLQLSCFISQDVKYLQTGLLSRLKETITKKSPSLDRDAQYTRISKISRLPAYLTIQLVRFFYKEKNSINAKILKDIKFSFNLDVFDLCTEELQQKLLPMRAKFKEQEDKNVEKAQKANEPTKTEEELNKKQLPYWFEDDIGSNNSGYYDLKAVLTHKGRSSSSGHYVAWIKKKNQWFKCDDDTVTPVSPDEILKLSGGGDWHCAYVLLYGPRIFYLDEKENV